MSRARDIADLGNEASGGLTSSDISDLNDNITAHIIPGVLYPAVADKMLDGTTSLSASTTGPGGSTVASSKYGTVQILLHRHQRK